MGKKLEVFTVIGLLALFNLSQNPSADELQANIAFSDFLFHVDNGQVRDVTIRGNTITGHFSDARSFRTYAPDDPNLIGRLIERGVRITAAPRWSTASLLLIAVLLVAVPMLLLIAALLIVARWFSSDFKALAAAAHEARTELARLTERMDALERGPRALE